MPRARKPCGIQGCTVIVSGTEKHCPAHKHRFTNGGRTRTFNPRHRAWREAVLKRDNYKCQLRIRGVCVWSANEADHIKPVAEGGAEYDLANGAAICTPCHRWKSSREGHRAQGHRVRE